MNDFVALLLAVTAFLAVTILTNAVLPALANWSDHGTNLTAFGPPAGFTLATATGITIYRKLISGQPVG